MSYLDSDLAACFEDQFAFAIGEVVQHAGYEEPDVEVRKLKWERPVLYVVVERSFHQCHGGIQRIYYVSPVLPTGAIPAIVNPGMAQYVRFSETELKRRTPCAQSPPA